MSQIKNLSRRSMLKGAAATGAFVLGVHVTGKKLIAHAMGAETGTAGGRFAPNVWLSIAPNGDVTILASRSEMGQGVRTSLPTIVADELEADWKRVTVKQAPGDAKYGNQDTDGSRSVRTLYQAMREAGAAARMMLEQAAANIWKVDVSDVYAQNHEIKLRRSRKSFSYGELALMASRLEVPATDTLRLKDEKDFRYIGRDQTSVDVVDITRGKATYGADIRLPEMRFAVIARPPVVGGSMKSFDATATKAIPGVEAVVPLPTQPGAPAFNPLGGVAVIATSTWAALRGREQLVIEWNDSPNAAYQSEGYEKTLADAAKSGEGVLVRSSGDFDAAHTAGANKVEADYYAPHLAHAPMEPPCATAHVTDTGCKIWSSTQNPQLIGMIAASLLRMKPEQIKSYTTLLGGGFGRKSKPDFAIEAILLSRHVKKPVQVLWTREDDIQHGYYHTVSASHLGASMDDDGKVTAWLHRAAMPSIMSTFQQGVENMADFELSQGMLDMPYDIPNIKMENAKAPAHVRIGWFRSVFNVPTAFAICSFADEVAHARGKDPLDNLLDLIGPARHVVPAAEPMAYGNYDEPLDRFPIDTGRLANVVRLAARKARWGRRMPKGRGLGIAAHRSFLTYVATVVEVEIDDAGALKIVKVDTAVDCGRVINPDRVKSQMEGAAVFATSLALYGEITATDGAIDQSNFHDYPMTRMSMAPRVDVHLVESEALPSGIGEPGVPPFAPALCNAIFAATGKRIRRLPIGETIET